MDEFLSGFKDVYRPWESEGVSKTARDILCDEYNRDFLQHHRLLSSFTKIFHVTNVADLTQRANPLRDHILENQVLQNSNGNDSRTMVLVWGTGAPYGLTPFRSDFIDYMKCNILVKEMTKVNSVIGIRNTFHKFIERNGQDIIAMYLLPTQPNRCTPFLTPDLP